MKKIMSFIMFVILLSQVAGVVHAFADSLHSEEVHNIIISDEDTNFEKIDSDKLEIASKHQNCSQNCHGHSHFYLNAHIVKSLVIQKEVLLNNNNFLFTSLIHTPDSPPPNFS